MSRMIDADALMADIKECIEIKYANSEYEQLEGLEIALSCVDEQPTIEPEPRWIPCSEKMPEMGQSVIDNYMSLNWLSYLSYGKAWTFERPDVIKAWMPLPEPYKEDTDGDK